MNTEEHDAFATFSKKVNWHLGIGDVSAATGVSQSQLRYWEQKGYISSEKVNGQNRKYSYHTLIRVFMINNYINQGFTLTAAEKKASAHRETMDLLKRSMIDRFQGISKIDGYPAINLGFVDDQQTKILYLVVKEDRTDVKIVEQH
ncbi:MerR family transcriptional regulator [Secundilactobacillus yichangensis]|uniref:MerR family transcriptional regulator n=1 Tax=Secundilactobacillus yichangensis TaxID=2799580 RepID=UPI001F3D8465|nr:MerR family transcriptional regulator [Secundilactobacillus yichangensis]